MKNTSKFWWQSKTVWMNVLTIVVMILMQVVNSPEFKDYSHFAVTALAFANILLRVVTDAPIKK